jgi:hypothetical protein
LISQEQNSFETQFPKWNSQAFNNNKIFKKHVGEKYENLYTVYCLL